MKVKAPTKEPITAEKALIQALSIFDKLTRDMLRAERKGVDAISLPKFTRISISCNEVVLLVRARVERRLLATASSS